MVGCSSARRSRSSSARRPFRRRSSRCCSDEAGAKVYIISHIASGPYTADKFEREMQNNVDTMVRALVTRNMSRDAGEPPLLEIVDGHGPPRPGARCSPTSRSRSTWRTHPRDRRTERRRQEHAARARCSARWRSGPHRRHWRRERPHRLRAADLRRRSDPAGHRSRSFSR